MRVFLNTNVLVSAFTSRGLCADVFRHMLAEHELASGEVVVEELRRLLTEKFGVPTDVVTEITDLVRNQSRIAATQPPTDIEIRDPDDAAVLSAALATNAAVLVTGDADLLDLELPDALRTITPRDYWREAKT